MTDSKNLATALAAFQAELPRVGKGNTANTGTYSFKYADLADVAAVVLPLLGKHGMSFSAKPTLDDNGRFVLAYTLRHESGDSDSGAYPLPPSGSPQQIGSAITYARRYALCAVTGVAADEDDDGQAAATTRVEPERHEHSYDAAEQEMLREGYQAEIDAATSVKEIVEIGSRVRAKQRSGDLSPATYQHLATYAARRRADLDKPAEPEQPTLPAATDTPSRRQQQLAAMDAKVAKRKEAENATAAAP